MSDYLGYNTHVSDPGQPEGFSSPDWDANAGGSAAGSGMQVHHGVMLIIGVAAAGLIAISYVFRKPLVK